MDLARRLVFVNRSILRKKVAPLCTTFSLKQSQNTQTPKKLVAHDLSKELSQGTIKHKGFIFYVIIRELFSGKSPTRVYEEALKICTTDTRIQDLLGEPITGCGETTRRGRRTHVASQEWLDNNGKKHMVMRFYLKGVYASGTAHLEIYETNGGEMEYRYLVVEVEGLTRRQVILRPEENQVPVVAPPPPPPTTLQPLETDQ